ncbi:SDR family oxidoreductase [Asanoa sp. NPDC049573]|uniref:SDR family oxidoreductase n=1 Tax=Asanoa sp. NPDC049573 TaxID=3155396 RepID=UPI003430A2F1
MALHGQRVLLVGGTSGLGLAVAQAVAERGGTPVVASRSRDRVERALRALPGGAEGATVDLADATSVAGLAERAGPVDHLVYTAGEPLALTMLADLTTDVAQRFYATRLFGALAVVRAVRAAGTLSEAGSVVLTGGNASQRSAPGWALGASICGAIEALTRQLALELAPVRVNAIAPGVTRTPMWAAGMSEAEQRAMFDELAGSLPVGRPGEPEDVALAYVYAMEQPMATGTVLLVDGGAVLV